MTSQLLSVYFWQKIDTAQGILIRSVHLLIKYLEKIGELFFTFTSMSSDIFQRKSRHSRAHDSRHT